MKKISKYFLVLMLLSLSIVALVACDGEKLTVTFDSCGGSNISSVAVKSGEKVSKPSDPEKEGYIFDGWYVSSSDFIDDNKWSFVGYPVTEDITLYAKWNAVNYSVSYNGNSATGSMYNSSFTFDVSGTLRTNAFSKTGYSFSGWALSSNSEVVYLDNEEILNLTNKQGETVTLFAQWVANSYSVIYNGNGETAGATIDSEHIYDISSILSENGYTKTGYTFAGWATSANGAIIYADKESVQNLTSQSNGSVELFAKWAYVISYDGNGATEGSVADSSHIYGTASSLSTNSFTKEGYSFAGWETEDGLVFYANMQNITTLTTMTLYAKWTINKYSLSVTNGNTLAGNTSVGGSYDYNTFITLTATANDGYTFLGWYDSDTLLSEDETFSFNMPAGDKTYTAKWGDYNITLRKNIQEAGSVNGAGKYVAGTIRNIEASTNPGYTWLGWYNGNDLITGNIQYEFAMPFSNIEYEARWGDYNVSIVSNIDGAGIVTGSGKYIEGSERTISTITNLGYVWIGWYNNNTLVTTDATYNFAMPATNITYEARWEVLAQMLDYSFSSTTTSLTITGYSGDTTDITIPSIATNIGTNAFYDNATIINVIIPEGIATIEAYAFRNCPLLISITISSSVKNIGNNAFYNCIALKSINVDNNNLLYSSQDGIIYNKEKTQFIYVPISVMGIISVPQGITMISTSQFKDRTSITNLIIPSSVTIIETGAFSGCSGLISLTIPFVGSSMTSTGVSALFGVVFGATTYLGSIKTDQSSPSGVRTFYLPATLKTIIITHADKIAEAAFSRCQVLMTIQIPSTVTSIGKFAFVYCTALKNINIPSISNIEDGTFAYCSSLKSITIPSSVTKIGNYVFEGCSGLTSMTIPFIGASRTISGSQLSVFGYLFGSANYAGGTSAYQIYSYTGYYDGTRSFDTVQYYIPSNLETVIITDATFIPIGAFSNCRTLVNIVLPQSVTTVWDYAFRSCVNLTTVNIGHNVKTIYNSAFDYCLTLKSILLPSNISTISTSAFSTCDSLTIFTELVTRPTSWAADWNKSNRPIVWGCTFSDDKTYVESFIKTSTSILNSNASNGISPPQREGYTFNGWNTEPDGNGITYLLTNQSQYNAIPDSTKLYAIWISN